MDKAKILAIVNGEAGLFNARYYKDAGTIAAFINEQHGNTTTDSEVMEAIRTLKIHPGTGTLME